MSGRRFIIEMGTGNSQHGQDYTRAAGRAIEDAIRHAQLSILSALGIDDQDMRVQVTVGVQKPEAVDCDALAGLLPRNVARCPHSHVRRIRPRTLVRLGLGGGSLLAAPAHPYPGAAPVPRHGLSAEASLTKRGPRQALSPV